MMETWYRAQWYCYVGSARVEEVAVERSTESSVWIRGGRNAKRTDTDAYFPTRDEAVEFIRAVMIVKAAELRHQLNQAEAAAEKEY